MQIAVPRLFVYLRAADQIDKRWLQFWTNGSKSKNKLENSQNDIKT